ncbi:MAG: nuclear transport factor 2 family protein [Gammaproteobacteria bacterium]
MSEADNVATMKRFYEAFMDGDIPSILSCVTDDFVLSNDFTPNVATAGKFHGKAGLEKFFKLLGEILSEVEIFQADHYIADGDRVVVLGHERMKVRATKRWVEANWAQVGTFRDGLMCEWVEYSDTAAWQIGCSSE